MWQRASALLGMPEHSAGLFHICSVEQLREIIPRLCKILVTRLHIQLCAQSLSVWLQLPRNEEMTREDGRCLFTSRM